MIAVSYVVENNEGDCEYEVISALDCVCLLSVNSCEVDNVAFNSGERFPVGILNVRSGEELHEVSGKYGHNCLVVILESEFNAEEGILEVFKSYGYGEDIACLDGFGEFNCDNCSGILDVLDNGSVGLSYGSLFAGGDLGEGTGTVDTVGISIGACDCVNYDVGSEVSGNVSLSGEHENDCEAVFVDEVCSFCGHEGEFDLTGFSGGEAFPFAAFNILCKKSVEEVAGGEIKLKEVFIIGKGCFNTVEERLEVACGDGCNEAAASLYVVSGKLNIEVESAVFGLCDNGFVAGFFRGLFRRLFGGFLGGLFAGFFSSNFAVCFAFGDEEEYAADSGGLGVRILDITTGSFCFKLCPSAFAGEVFGYGTN